MLSMCRCAPWCLLVSLFSICRLITLDVVNICNFQLVLHVAQKVFYLGSWNLTGILLSMWSFATGASLVASFGFVRVMSPDLIKLYNFHLVSHVAQTVFDIESWNLTRMLISMCNCAAGCFRVDWFSICRVIAHDLIKICNFHLVSHVAQKAFDL